MKTFNKALEERIKELGDPDNQEGLALAVYREGFKEGAKWASQSPELIDEILTKYDKWVMDTARHKFPDWLYEEGDYDKTLARVRKEFIEFLKPKV